MRHTGCVTPRVSAETAEERSLANWLKKKQTSCRHGMLPDDQLAKLRKIPGLSDFPQVSQESRKRAAEFDDACENFEGWCTRDSREPFPSSNKTEVSAKALSMAVWLKNKLAFYKHGKLPDDQITKMRKVPLFRTQAGQSEEESSFCKMQNNKWQGALERLQDPSNPKLPHYSHKFDHACESFKHWCALNKGTVPKLSGTTKEERSLAVWLRNKLYKYRRGVLPDDQLAKLQKLPHFMERSPSRSQKFDLVCSRFREWCAAHRGALPKRNRANQQETSLASWLEYHLRRHRHGKLSEKQFAKLRKIPGLSDFPRLLDASPKLADNFDRNCNRFKEWCSKHGEALPKQSGETAEERSLASWLKRNLYHHRRGKLADSQLEKMRTIPCLSEFPHISGKSQLLARKFDESSNSFKEWCAAHNGTLPKQHGETAEERSLAVWLRSKLCNYRHGSLSDEQLAKLRNIPCLSNFPHVSGRTQKFELSCNSFNEWCATHQGALPKRAGATKEERSLAIWFKDQLSKSRRGKLPDEHSAKLEKLPHFLERLSGRS